MHLFISTVHWLLDIIQEDLHGFYTPEPLELKVNLLSSSFHLHTDGGSKNTVVGRSIHPAYVNNSSVTPTLLCDRSFQTGSQVYTSPVCIGIMLYVCNVRDSSLCLVNKRPEKVKWYGSGVWSQPLTFTGLSRLRSLPPLDHTVAMGVLHQRVQAGAAVWASRLAEVSSCPGTV